MGIDDLETSIIPVDFQLEVLSFLVRDKEVLSRFSEVIKERHFENPAHRVLLMLVRKYFLEFLSMPSRATLERELGTWLKDNEGGEIVPAEFFWREVEKLYRLPLAERDYLIAKVTSFIQRSQIATLGETALQVARTSGDIPIDRVILEVNRLFTSLSGGIDERMEYLLADAEERERVSPALYKVPTGLRVMDQTLDGGLGEGELGIFIAPTGYGKSFALLTVGANAMRFLKKVLHITLEINRRKTIARYEAYLTRIPKRTLYMESEDVVRKLCRYRSLVNPADVAVVEYPSRGLTVDELRAVVTQVKVGRGFHPDLIVVDYADILKPVLSYRTEAGWEQLATIYQSLRGVAQEFATPIWTASQTTPASMQKEVVTIIDIAGSFAKVHAADVVIAICRTGDEMRLGKGRFFIDKNRDAPGNVTVPFREDFDTSRLWEESGAIAHREVSRAAVRFSDREAAPEEK